MRGKPVQQLAMLTSLSTEDLIPADYPIRRIRAVVDEVLADLDDDFDAMYSGIGRPSVPPEQLLKATVLMAMYSIRSERAFRERLNDGACPFRGQPRSNQTHRSTTDPEAHLACKGNTAARLCYSGHLLMENRNALIIDAELTAADGYAERATALAMLERVPRRARRRTVAADKGYDTAGFVASCRDLNVTPHVAQHANGRRSAIDGRTTRPVGHQISQRTRPRIEEPFGWIKTIAGGRKLRLRGRQRNTGLVPVHHRHLQPDRITSLDARPDPRSTDADQPPGPSGSAATGPHQPPQPARHLHQDRPRHAPRRRTASDGPACAPC